MNKKEIIEAAIKCADYNKFKGTMYATGDGNTFLGKNEATKNAVINHVRSNKENGKERLIYVIDNTGKEANCRTCTSAELLKDGNPNAAEGAVAPAASTDKEDSTVGQRASNNNEGGTTVSDYSNLKNAELKALCEERGIDIGKTQKNVDLIALIVADDIAKAGNDDKDAVEALNEESK